MYTFWPLGRAASQIWGIFAGFLLAVIIIYVDVLVLGNTIAEASLVEITQLVLILGSAILFGAGARKYARQRGYLAIVATLFLCMFLRENDALFDQIQHGFWRVPVLAVLVIGAFVVFKNRHTVRPPLQWHTQDSSFWILTVGFFQLLVFSRLFGSSQLWGQILSPADLGSVKAIIQESTELAGYALIFLGSLTAYIFRFGVAHDPGSSE
jgi:hypothetical protein